MRMSKTNSKMKIMKIRHLKITNRDKKIKKREQSNKNKHKILSLMLLNKLKINRTLKHLHNDYN